MSEFTDARVLGDGNEHERDLPPGVLLYEINGPMFFGAAQRAISALGAIHDSKRVVVLSLAKVGVIDATGFVALESALGELRSRHKFVIIAGPLPEPKRMFARARLEASFDHVLIAADETEALHMAMDLAQLNPQWQQREAALAARPPTVG
jgi:SulP family sulfate permease